MYRSTSVLTFSLFLHREIPHTHIRGPVLSVVHILAFVKYIFYTTKWEQQTTYNR